MYLMIGPLHCREIIGSASAAQRAAEDFYARFGLRLLLLDVSLRP